jgi:hypothetical protein
MLAALARRETFDDSALSAEILAALLILGSVYA